jgi:hypothetical protein
MKTLRIALLATATAKTGHFFRLSRESYDVG